MVDSTKQSKLVMSRSVIAKKEAKKSRDSGQNFIGVWLDDNSKRTDIEIYVEFKHEFENVFDCPQIFNATSACIGYLSDTTHGKILFIVSHKNASKVFDIIKDEDYLQIHYIYIFCSNETEKDSWKSTEIEKCRGSYVSKTELFQKVKDDILELNTENEASSNSQSEDIRNKRLANDIPPISVFNSKLQNNSIKHLSKDSAWFIRYQLLFDILLKLEISCTAKDEMIYVCSQFYKGNDIRLKQINEFEKDADNAFKSIYWYTKESFLVHLLNRACGTQNIDEIYPFRLFIKNLHGELVKLDELRRKTTPDSPEKITVFRGKPLASSTLENLRKNINGLVSMNGFLSTTKDELVAKCFAGDSAIKSDHKAVLFKLNIDHTVINKPYADIPPSRHAMEGQEKEVLFSIGSVWRINGVTELYDEHDSSKSNMCCVELTLSNEDDQESVDLANFLKKEIGDTSTVWTLGQFLTQLGEYEQAENYYRLLENVLPENQVDRATIYNRIAYLRHERGDPVVALEYFKKAMEYTSNDSEAYAAAVYNQEIIQTEATFCPPTLRRRFENHDIITKSLISNPASKPIILNNMGRTKHQQGDYISAMQYYDDALKLKSELTFLEISALYNNIGGVEYSRGNYSSAVEKIQKAMDTMAKFDPTHRWIGEYTDNLKLVQRYLDSPIPKRTRTD